MSSKYRLCLICLLWLGCLFCLTSGFAGDFFFAWNGAFETLVSAEERLNDDPPALNQVISCKNFSISAGASSEYSVPDLRISFSKIDRKYRDCIIKSSSLLFFSFLSGADFVNPMMCMECFRANAEDMLCLGFLLQYEGENFTL